jgi:hypothetical protein
LRLWNLKITVLVAGMGLIFSGFLQAAEAPQRLQPDSVGFITLSDDHVVNGGTLWLEIDTQYLAPPITGLQIRFEDRLIPVFQHPVKPDGVFLGLIGIPLQSEPGPAVLTVEGSDADGKHSTTIPFRIDAESYGIEELTVDPRKINLSEADLVRVRHEKHEIQCIYAEGNFARLWQDIFQRPVDSDVTSPFGNRRRFNARLKSYHNGVDFRSPPGKPVYAANSGIVKLAKNMFFSGNIVIIDHGTGVFSSYAHLSKINVIAGQCIERGQPIGLSGATGRVNGPHLHYGIKVNGTYVDPLQFAHLINSLFGNDNHAAEPRP